MPLRERKPVTPGQRGLVLSTHEEVTKQKPHRPLTVGLRKTGGRNDRGKITVRHHGGGHKRRLRLVDFKRNKEGVPGKVVTIEYDPNRSAHLALVNYADGDKRYILATENMKVGGSIEGGPNAEIKEGNSLPLKYIPSGTIVHNVELRPGDGGQLARSAGTGAQLLAREDRYAMLRLPSGEVRRVNAECMATIGQVGNGDHKNIKLGKAGRKRHMGIRPTVRGSAMSPRDHPHGGGEGRSPIGMPGPKTPWGKPALGYKTRKKRKISNRFIVKRRK